MDTPAEEALAALTLFERTPVSDADVMSIKVHAFDDLDALSTVNLGVLEYTDILDGPEGVASLVKTIDRTYAGPLFVFQLLDGRHFLFVEHESGPEIITLIDLASHLLQHGAVAVGSLGSLIYAVNRVVITLRKSLASQRVLSAELQRQEAVRVARRTRNGVRTVKVLRATQDIDAQAVTSAEELV
jgi:hypothetical protein